MPGYGSYNYYNKKRKKKKENFIDKFTEKAQRIAKRHKEYNPVIIEKGARTICKS